MEEKIGIFDSGIGGLTVARAIRTQIPRASITYFGDTAHLPYGDKSPASIRNYAAKITHFLLDKGCNSIVIACNTASAHAYKTVLEIAGSKIPVFNVIDPVVQHIVNTYSQKKIGIIATKGTIKTRIYPRRIKTASSTLSTASKATPLLAPMIEEGFFNNNISKTIIDSYLSSKELKNIDALVLGCTHYPLIINEVQGYFKGTVDIIDSAQVVARAVAERISAKGKNSFSEEFFVSDYTKAFEKSTQVFFGEKISLTEKRIFD